MTEPVEGQGTSAAEEAEAVVRAAFAALDAMRWSEAAALVHPETLERIRAWELQSARDQQRLRDEPLAYYRGAEMPPEVVAWHAEQRRRHERRSSGSVSWLSWQFAGIGTLEQLEALSAEELFARHLEASDPRAQLARHVRGTGQEVPPEVAEAVAGLLPQRAVIGSVVENDATVHVVYRTRSGAGPDVQADEVATVTVRRTPQGWRLWTGSRDRALFRESHTGLAFFSVADEEEERERLRGLAERVVTWPLEGGGEARAFLTGYTGGMEPARSLVVEVARPDGTEARVEIPAEAFTRVAELLLGWPDSGAATSPD